MDRRPSLPAEGLPTDAFGESKRLLEGVDAEKGSSGRISPSGRTLSRRRTIAMGEQYYPSKLTTWTIEDSQESMGDAELVVNLLADLTPAGILPLSYGMQGTGYIPAAILLLGFSAAAAFMLFLIGKCVTITGEMSYDRIWSAVVGPRTAWVPTLIVVLVCFGNCLAYAAFFGDLFSGAMPALGLSWLTRARCIVALAVFPVLPLCMLKDLSALAPTSFGALLMVVYTVGMIVYRFFDGSYAIGGQFGPAQPSEILAPASDYHLFNFGFSTLLLVNSLAIAFLCHYNGCKYYREYVHHTPGRFVSKVSVAFGAIDVIFMCAMMFGFATFGAASDGVILNNYAETDTLANIARLGMGVANMFSFPLMFSGLREASLAFIVFVAPGWSDMCMLIWFQNTLSALLVAIITIAAVLITDAGLVVGLVGSICGSAIIYVVPCILYDCVLKTHHGFSDGTKNTWQVPLVQTIGFVGVFLMIAGAIVSVTA